LVTAPFSFLIGAKIFEKRLIRPIFSVEAGFNEAEEFFGHGGVVVAGQVRGVEKGGVVCGGGGGCVRPRERGEALKRLRLDLEGWRYGPKGGGRRS
jgi:hypothetical protein